MLGLDVLAQQHTVPGCIITFQIKFSATEHTGEFSTNQMQSQAKYTTTHSFLFLFFPLGPDRHERFFQPQLSAKFAV